MGSNTVSESSPKILNSVGVMLTLKTLSVISAVISFVIVVMFDIEGIESAATMYFLRSSRTLARKNTLIPRSIPSFPLGSCTISPNKACTLSINVKNSLSILLSCSMKFTSSISAPTDSAD